MSKISGPLLDRIDIHLDVPAVPFDDLSDRVIRGTTSNTMRSTVIDARYLQSKRFQNTPQRYNAQMTSRQVRAYCPMDRKCTQMLRHCVEELGLSARAHDKILRVARTIADLGRCKQIREQDLAEAIGYRSLDRELWT